MEDPKFNDIINLERLDAYTDEMKKKVLTPMGMALKEGRLLANEKNVTVTTSSIPDEETLSYVDVLDKKHDHIVGDKRIVVDTESEDGYTIYTLLAIDDGKAKWRASSGEKVKESLTISLASNQGNGDKGLYGATVEVIAGGQSILQTTWQGEMLTAKITPLTEYTVKVGEVQGYRSDSTLEQTFTSAIGGERFLTFNYSTTVVTIQATSNQSNDTVLNGLSFKVNETTLSNGETVRIPTGTEIVVESPDIEHYAKTVTIPTTNATGVSQTITVAYQTTLVSVNMTANRGELPTGTKATVKYTYGNSDEKSQEITNGATAKVPTGAAFSITFADVSGYSKPADIVGQVAGGAAMSAYHAQYTKGALTVVFASNLGGTDPDIANMSAEVSYGEQKINVTPSTGAIDIADGESVTIKFNDVEGYTTPATQTFMMTGEPVTKTGTYETTVHTISIVSNQPQDAVIAEKTASLQYQYGGSLVKKDNLSNGATVKVPATGASEIAVSADDVEFYSKTIGNTGNTWTVQYSTTIVSVQMVSVDNNVEGAAPQGAQATVKYTDNISGEKSQVITNDTTAKVPTGLPFTVEYSAVQNYGTPATYSGTATGVSMAVTKAKYMSGVLSIEVRTSDNDDEALETAKVYVKTGNNQEQELEGSVASHVKTFTVSVQPGETFSVRYGEIEGYATPAQVQSQEKSDGVTTLQATFNTTIYSLSITSNLSPDAEITGKTEKVSYNGLATPKTISNNGTIKVPTGMVPTVEDDKVEGYSREVTVNSTNTYVITVAYTTTQYTVNITSNQSNDSVISAKTASLQYQYGGSLVKKDNLSNGATVKVPATGASGIEVTADDERGYTKKVSYTGTTYTVAYTTEILTVQLSADEGKDVSGQQATVTDTSNSSELGKLSNGQTLKIASGTQYKVSVGNIDGYTTPEEVTHTAGSGADAAFTANMEWKYNPVMYAYITIDQSQSGESAMISGDVKNEAIQALRAASHLYLGKQTAEGKQLLCQLDDANGNNYFDGSEAKFDGTEGDHWLRIGIDFYIKRTNVDGKKTTYGIAVGGRPDDTWKQIVTPNDLLGVHEAYIASQKLYSRSNVQSGASQTRDTFKQYARNRGKGYTLVTWEWHCVMAFLFYAWYGRTNSQAQCGTGSSSYTRTLGKKNSLGMTDTTSSNGNSDDVKFWGIENWWGDKCEWIDNVDVNNRVWTITDPKNNQTRNAGTAESSDGWIKELMLSEDLDMIPTGVGGSETTYFCDYYWQNSGSRVVYRSYFDAYSDGGVAYVVADYDASGTNLVIGSRLAFNGEIEIAESVAAFKGASNIG